MLKMFFLDLISDIMWWSEQLWYFMKLLPPTDWTSPPDYYYKLALYFLPLFLIVFFPYIWLILRSFRKKNDATNPIQVVMLQFKCPHCGHVPEPPPVSGAYYCAKCGKSSQIKSYASSDAFFKV
jgi:DNA-directed RNA polymerase subunit RPC12/RpoP